MYPSSVELKLLTCIDHIFTKGFFKATADKLIELIADHYPVLMALLDNICTSTYEHLNVRSMISKKGLRTCVKFRIEMKSTIMRKKSGKIT